MTGEPRCPRCAGPLPRHYPPCNATRVCGPFQLGGCPQSATHRYHYDFRPAEGHQVPVSSDLCPQHAEAFGAFLGRVEAIS